MALIVLTSASGSPGVTTTALGLALAWLGYALFAEQRAKASVAVPEHGTAASELSKVA